MKGISLMIKFNKEFFVGMTVGFSAGVVVGALVEKDKRSLKGISKELIRLSLLSVEKIKESVVRAKENFEDLTAEVQSELRHKAPEEEFQMPKKSKQASFAKVKV
jgi:hypothetical protein